MTCYLNIEAKTIQYQNSEDLIELNYEPEEIESLRLDKVIDLIKTETDQLLDYHFNYQ